MFFRVNGHQHMHIDRDGLTRHRLDYFRTHDRLGGSDPTPPPAISRTNGRIEPREAAFESSLRVLSSS